MHVTATHSQRVLQLIHKNGWLRASDLAHAGIRRVVLTRMTASGQLVRAARGLYRLPNASSSEHEGLATVARKVPQAVICLLSAWQFHGLTNQLPWQVWVATPRGSHVPRLDHPPIKMVQFTAEAYTHGIEAHERDDVTLRMYGAAKTVADCFKHGNKIGMDVALEALKDARAAGRKECRASFDDLWRCAKVCRVANVMRPYMEAMACACPAARKAHTPQRAARRLPDERAGPQERTPECAARRHPSDAGPRSLSACASASKSHWY